VIQKDMQTVAQDINDERIIPSDVQSQLDSAENEYERGEFFKVDEGYFESLKARVLKRLSLEHFSYI
jgi:transcription antitermination factor NusG